MAKTMRRTKAFRRNDVKGGTEKVLRMQALGIAPPERAAAAGKEVRASLTLFLAVNRLEVEGGGVGHDGHLPVG